MGIISNTCLCSATATDDHCIVLSLSSWSGGPRRKNILERIFNNTKIVSDLSCCGLINSISCDSTHDKLQRLFKWCTKTFIVLLSNPPVLPSPSNFQICWRWSWIVPRISIGCIAVELNAQTIWPQPGQQCLAENPAVVPFWNFSLNILLYFTLFTKTKMEIFCINVFDGISCISHDVYQFIYVQFFVFRDIFDYVSQYIA